MTEFNWIVLIVLTVFVAISLFRRSIFLKIAVLVMLLAALIDRELSIGAYARYISWNRAKEGVWSEQFKDGLTAVLEYCDSTKLYLISLYFLIFVLAVRGFWVTRSKH
jgi:hypothetical protein